MLYLPGVRAAKQSDGHAKPWFNVPTGPESGVPGRTLLSDFIRRARMRHGPTFSSGSTRNPVPIVFGITFLEVAELGHTDTLNFTSHKVNDDHLVIW
jgi:hypothetical protein